MASANNLRLNGLNPLSYLGVNPTVPVPFIAKNYSPQPNDVQNIFLGTIWLNTVNYSIWMLVGVVNYQAQWIQIGTGGSGGIQTLTSNDFVVVGPSSGNINVVGDGTYIVGSGDASTSTITFGPGTGFLKTFETGSGSATPSGGEIYILGGTGITTSGSGDMVTIGLSGPVATSYVTNSGTAIPAGNILQVVGGGNTTTSASGNVITVSTSGSTATNYITNSGTAVPSSGNIQIKGAGVVTTTGSSNLVTAELTSSTNGQLIIGSTASGPAWATLTAGANTTITNGSNSITIASSAGGFSGTTSFAAYPSAINSYNVPYPVTIIFDQTKFDLGSNFNTSSYQYTAPSTGYYQMSGVVYITNQSSAVSLYLVVSGTSAFTYSLGEAIPSGYIGGNAQLLTFCQIIEMTAGDAVEIQCLNTGGGSWVVRPYVTPAPVGFSSPLFQTYWCGYRVA